MITSTQFFVPLSILSLFHSESVAAQKVKEAEITEQDSLLLTRNLLRIAIFNISYIRGLFPEKYFNDKSVPALGVYDALQKRYLKTLLFCVCEAVDGPMIEEYAFSFCYSDSDNQEVSMNINRTGNKKKGTFKYNSTTEITPQQMRSSACKMIRTLVQLMRTLEKMPEEPADYEPPFFRGCTEEEAYHPWSKNPLKMEVGNVNSKHFVLALKVKSVLDPCEDDNEEMQDDTNTCNDSMQQDEYDDTDSEVDHSQGNQYTVVPIEKQQAPEDNSISDEGDIDVLLIEKLCVCRFAFTINLSPRIDIFCILFLAVLDISPYNTQDPVEDEQQLARVKEWVNCCHLDTIELTVILCNFPDISVKSEYEFTIVKEEVDGQAPQVFEKPLQSEDLIYMKALYQALPMTYVSVSKLQSLLEGDVNLTAARRIIDKMTGDGFLEPKGNKRLGKRVIHSELSERKFIEVQKALNAMEAMDVDHCEPNSKPKQSDFRINGSNYDVSTCGVLHSIGSDLTRMKVTSETNYTDSMKSGQKVFKAKHMGNTPTSKVEPVDSRESFAQGKENSTENVKRTPNQKDEADINIFSYSSQDKRPRKTSAVKEPIHQNVKRQRAQTPRL
ncbi:unnamed protein product [Lupinus luteus]|uniref:HORMA domain-containing protein n=1 Tax=Lupinus luteus TaxID=3873 RepID=A0AAV1W1Q3_LUPLU